MNSFIKKSIQYIIFRILQKLTLIKNIFLQKILSKFDKILFCVAANNNLTAMYVKPYRSNFEKITVDIYGAK